MSGLNSLKLPQIKKICKVLNVSTTGKKLELITRLEQTPQFQTPTSPSTPQLNAHQQTLENLLKECEEDLGMMLDLGVYLFLLCFW